MKRYRADPRLPVMEADARLLLDIRAMCGISGIIYKKGRSQGPAPVGKDLVGMLDSLAHRGRDSSGVTVVGAEADGELIIRVWTDDREHSHEVFAISPLVTS